jgi:hypothetical protein
MDFMSVQTLKLAGKRFVILPESEYRKLAARPAAAKNGAARKRGPSKQELGDLAEHRRRLAEGGARPYEELRKELGLK